MLTLRSRYSTTFVTLAITTTCWASPSAAAIIATDSGTNYTKNQPYVGLNRGTGFGVWTLDSGTGTNTIGSRSRFNQTASVGGTPYILKRDINVPLAVGDTLSFTLEVENAKKVGGGARILFYAAGAQAAELRYLFGDVTWRWEDGSGSVSTGVNYVKNAVLTVSFTRTSSSAGYQFSLAQPGQTTYNKTGTITGGAGTSAIDNFRFSARTASTPETKLYYNTLQVQSVPEPSAVAMLATAAVGGLGLAILRQRRRHLRAAACPAPLGLAA